MLLECFLKVPALKHVDRNGSHRPHLSFQHADTGLCSKEASKSITSCSLIGSNTFTPYTINVFIFILLKLFNNCIRLLNYL